ncbi:autoinducer-2 kinase [Geomicrobium sp. JCM 19039]|uniref:autoinducer-2 kinase n=1 Tax=Geomicrobium sp. JCM 19039 TaxID=1460636 RepID=UPI00045F4138|nr:autoinducer-2 kinase [Geomicrobium sp. JCM 19039]GAK13987.1 autoinducer 2 (AI-2) kinase LsrK [Geomicrobium sp. JCM 19039]
MDYYLALDAGTGSFRAVLFDGKGRHVKVVQKEWYHLEDPEVEGSMNFDYEENWLLVKRCIKEVSREVERAHIRTVSATSMREGFVLLDQQGKELWACANVDARAAKEVRELKEKHRTFEEEVYKTSGQTFALGALPRLLWLEVHEPLIYNRMDCLLMINDWILYKLCGVKQTDPSNGCTTGIFSLEKRSWSKEIANRSGMERNIFPEVNEPGTCIGYVESSLCEEIGLDSCTKVISGGGDAQVASIGVGAVHHGDTVISGGSFWQQEVNVSTLPPRMEANVRVNCHATCDLWQIETIVFTPGLVMRWFKNTFCHNEELEAGRLKKNVYELMEEKARHVPVGSYGVIPIFSDVMNFIEWRHAAPSFLNLSTDPKKSGHVVLYRSLLENTALATYGNLKRIEQEVNYYPTQVIFAGGAAKGKLWCQILADVLGVPVKVPAEKEAAALGTALLSATAVGAHRTLQDAVHEWVEWEQTYTPNRNHHEQYMKLYETWRSAYAVQLQLADEGTTKHMWKAPGL